MLLCFWVDLISESFLNDVKKVNFAEKMINLLFISLKIMKCLLNSTLLINRVVYKHVVKMSAILTLCFDLEVEVKVINIK